MALGSYFLGIIAGAFGYPTIYEIGIVLIVVASLEYFALIHKKDKLETEANPLVEI